jgi:hypothetical protein
MMRDRVARLNTPIIAPFTPLLISPLSHLPFLQSAVVAAALPFSLPRLLFR